jgi:hypothetical protein
LGADRTIGHGFAVEPLNRVMRAGFNARAAMNAAIIAQQHFHARRLTFGIVTPPTAQRAAFEEDRGAEAGTVVDGIVLDVKNQAASHGARISAMRPSVN